MRYFKRLYRAFQLARKAFGKYRSHVATLALLGFLSGAIGGIGINALIPLISFLIGSSPATDGISNFIRNAFATVGLEFTFQALFIMVAVLFLLQFVLVLLFDYVKIRIVAGYEKETRTRLFRHTLASSWPNLLREKIGHLETVLMVNVRVSSEMLEHLSQLLIVSSTLLIYTAIAFNISPSISLITFAFGTILLFFFQPILARSRASAGAMQKLNKESAHFINEQILGMKVVKSLHAERVVTNLGTQLFDQVRVLRIRMFILRSLSGSLMRPFTLLMASGVFAVSYALGVFEFAALIVVLYLIQQIFSYFQQLLGHLQRMSESVSFVENILSYERRMLDEKEHEVGVDAFVFTQNLAFNGVSFAYGKAAPVLSNVSFTIAKGAFVGIAGASGSGKTTVVDLLLRLLMPSAGALTIDGSPVDSVKLSEWRRHIGYVPQEVFLLNGTVEENIKFFDGTISDEAMIEAAKAAHIYDEIMEKPERFRAPVGERGTLFSAGQRQRIALARILARRPTILILDEATSSLDAVSERHIHGALEELRGRITIIAIAHRIPTILHADHILLLEKGKLVEEGKPAELLGRADSRFARLHKAGR